MMTWLTKMSFLDTMEDFETPLLAQVAQESHDLIHAMLLGQKLEGFPDAEKHPVFRMWVGSEVALGAYSAAAGVELNRRGIGNGLHLQVNQIIAQLRRNEDAPFEQPPWLFDTDVLRSHRSNMARRWPTEYGETWQGTPELWPYLWPFPTDEDGSFGLFLSAHDKALLKSGERKLPKPVRERIENL